MKSINLKELEKINLEGWNLTKETPAEMLYQKGNSEKKVTIFETYSLEENFKNKKLHGVTIGRMKKPFLHYPNIESRIYLIENFLEGKKEGIEQRFFEDGSSVSQEWENDRLHGKWEEWFGNGQKEIEKTYVDGKLNGQQYEWYKNGKLKFEESFSKGVQTGEKNKFLENGKLKRNQPYKDGKVEGIVYELWDYKGKLVDGGLYSETEYQDGVKQGKETVFYPDKTKMREGFNQNGMEHGERIWWSKSGIISIKEYYENGELDGQRFIYNELGELEMTQLYEKGNRIV